MPRRRTKNEILKTITGIKRRIAAERDKLRNAIADLDDIADECDTAIDDLESAADTLSQHL